MLSKQCRLVPLALTISLLAGGCREDTSPLIGPEEVAANGKGLTLLLTDAPGDFESAVVTIDEIYFQGQGGRVVLLDEPFTADLLALRNDVATVVQGLEIPAGSYSQLRLVVSGAYIEVETAGGSRIYASSSDYSGLPSDAQVHGSLQMPSMGQSGLKVKMPDGKLDIGDGETIVLIDFDVEQSFGHQAGKSGKWVMHPVVTATDVTFGGNVVARLELGSDVEIPDVDGEEVTLGNFKALLIPENGGDEREIELTDADDDGIFEAMFKGLVPGQYDLDFIVPDGLIVSFDPDLPRTVTVVSRQTVTETVTVESAELAGSLTATLVVGSGVTLPTVGNKAVTLAQFRARVIANSDTTNVTFTDADSDGTYEATFFLPEGEYSLTLVAPTGVNATYDPAPPVTVTLAAGGTETRAFTVTAASAQ